MVETDATEGFQQRSEVIFRSDFRSRDCMLGFDLGLSQNPGGTSQKYEKRIIHTQGFAKHQKFSKSNE